MKVKTIKRDLRNKDFVQLKIASTPMIAALAVLIQLKREVAGVETKSS